jgi:hypothetical protein
MGEVATIVLLPMWSHQEKENFDFSLTPYAKIQYIGWKVKPKRINMGIVATRGLHCGEEFVDLGFVHFYSLSKLPESGG